VNTMKCQGLKRGLEAFNDAVQAVIKWHEEVCEELRRAADALLLLDVSINSARPGTASDKDNFRAFHLSSRSTGRRALKSNTKAVHSKVLWPTEPRDQFIIAEIIKLLVKALNATDIWEAMEYLMAARGLLSSLRQENTRCE